MLEPWIKELLLKKVDPKAMQSPTLTREQAVHHIEQAHAKGGLYIIGSKENQILVLFNNETPFVAQVDVVCGTKNPKQLIEGLQQITDWGWKNTEFWKLKMNTHQEKVAWLAERLGWKHEGTGEEEHLDVTQGRFVPVYYYGLVRPDEYKTKEYMTWVA